MRKDLEKFNLLDEEISEEGVDFHSLQAEEDEDENILDTVEDPKVQENINSVNTDDSVKIYLQQIGKIPMLSPSEELDVANTNDELYIKFERSPENYKYAIARTKEIKNDDFASW